MTKKIYYSEPADYFPKSIRKEFKIGEYAETQKKAAKTEKPVKESPKKKHT